MQPITDHRSEVRHADRSQPADPQMPLPRFAPGNADSLTPAVTLQRTGEDVVVLDHRDEDRVETYLHGEIRPRHPDVHAAPISDPARQAELLRDALAATTAERRSLQIRNQTLHAAIEAERADREHTMDRVRSYVIERGHLAGHICAEGLNEFLTEFDLEEYNPRTRVEFTITGHLEIDSANPEAVADNIRYHLRVDCDNVPDVDEDSCDYSVSVDDVEVTGAST